MADLGEKSYDELIEMAKDGGVTGRYSMNKEQLVEALSDDEADEEPIVDEAPEEEPEPEPAAKRRPSADVEVALACPGCGAVNVDVPLKVGGVTDWTCGECGRKQTTLAVSEAG